MIINFLQTRNPPILPPLQQNPYLEPKIMSGLNVAFDKDITAYCGFGSENKDSLGVLLFQFFRYYGHEMNFENSVISVRTGRIITKLEKNWHLLQDNRLCVEEPFNTSRNLGNTADDTSVRGIHLELRRAFKMASEANLARCCAEYEPPSTLVDDIRPLERQPIPLNRPTLAYPAATTGRATRGGGRGGRHNNQSHRNSNTARRASNPSTRAHAYPHAPSLGASATHPELSLQHQQYLLHDRLFQQYQFLQAQEQELRAQLHQQAVLQGRIMPTTGYSPFLLPYGAYASAHDELTRPRAGTINQPPLTAPLRPQAFSFQSPYGSRTPMNGPMTNPPSPLLQPAVLETRRSYRRSSLSNGPLGGSLRAHSQPPPPLPSPLLLSNSTDKRGDHILGRTVPSSRDRISSVSNPQESFDAYVGTQRHHFHPGADRRGSEYLGYYIGTSPPLPLYSRSVVGSPFIHSTGLGIQNGAMSPQFLSQLTPNPLGIPSQRAELGCTRPSEAESTQSELVGSLQLRDASKRPTTLSRSSSGPVVVNGSGSLTIQQRQNMVDARDTLNTLNFDTSASDDVAVDTPSSSDDTSHDLFDRLIVNNDDRPEENTGSKYAASTLKSKSSKHIVRRADVHTDSIAYGSESAKSCGSPSLENMSPEPPPTNGNYESLGLVTADLALHQPKESLQRALQLSPVKEVRTPSPTKSRQLSNLDSAGQPTSKAKTKGKPKQKKTSLSAVDQSEENPQPLGPQPNGATLASSTSNAPTITGSASVWQTQKKRSKHNKGSKSETDIKRVNSAGGEFLPLDETMRKGG
jgi:Cid1 family poly A polymerase